MPRLSLTALLAASLVCLIDGAETSCSPGMYLQDGATECTYCEPGTFANKKGATSCQVCDVGKFTNNRTGTESCIECASGKYANSNGSIECATCGLGTFGAVSGMSSCLNCPAGEYQGAEGRTACETCPSGQFASEGSASCTDCAAGSYSEEGAPECSRCDLGKFQPIKGQSFCKSCATGYYSNILGATACLPCGYSDSGGTAPLSEGEDPPAGSHFTTVLGEATSIDACTCQIYYSGNNCDQAECSATLPGFSLGTVLLLGSAELQAQGNFADDDIIKSTSAALTALLKSCDTNGNRVLERDEMEAAVSSLHITLSEAEDHYLPTWSTPLPRPTDTEEYYLIVGGSYAGRTITVNEISIYSLYCVDAYCRELETVSIASSWFANDDGGDTSKCTDTSRTNTCSGEAPLTLRFAAPAGVRRVLIEHASITALDVVLGTDADGAAAVWASYVDSPTPAPIQEASASSTASRSDEYFLIDFISQSSVSIDLMAEQAMLSFRKSGTFDFTGGMAAATTTAVPTPGPTSAQTDLPPPSTPPTPPPTSMPTPMPTPPPSTLATPDPTARPNPLPMSAPTLAPSPVPSLTPSVQPSPGCAENIYRLRLLASGGDDWRGATFEMQNAASNLTVVNGILSDAYERDEWLCLPNGCYRLVVSVGDSAPPELGFECVVPPTRNRRARPLPSVLRSNLLLFFHFVAAHAFQHPRRPLQVLRQRRHPVPWLCAIPSLRYERIREPPSDVQPNRHSSPHDRSNPRPDALSDTRTYPGADCRARSGSDARTDSGADGCSEPGTDDRADSNADPGADPGADACSGPGANPARLSFPQAPPLTISDCHEPRRDYAVVQHRLRDRDRQRRGSKVEVHGL